MDNEVDDFLAHYGVLGMKWGHRKAQDSGSSTGESGNHQKLKKAGIIIGTAAGAALIAAGTVYLAKNGKLPISSFSPAKKDAGKKFVDDVISHHGEDLPGIAHMTGAGYLADRTRARGGLRDVFAEAQKAGLANQYGEQAGHGHYRRYGAHLEKVAVSFADPQGRKDFSGRPIVHRIILPKQHASGVTNFEQARQRAWDLVKHDYEKFSQYASSPQANNEEARRLGLMT